MAEFYCNPNHEKCDVGNCNSLPRSKTVSARWEKAQFFSIIIYEIIYICHFKPKLCDLCYTVKNKACDPFP